MLYDDILSLICFFLSTNLNHSHLEIYIGLMYYKVAKMTAGPNGNGLIANL